MRCPRGSTRSRGRDRERVSPTSIRQPLFGGETPSLADVMIAAQVDFFTATPEWSPLTAKNPDLVRWMDRMHDRPSMRATAWERVAAMAQAS